MPLPAATTREARGARPVHQLADERGLVAVGERIDDAGLARALRASSGPASASASTFTITMCLPCAQQASTCAMPAAGLPVASITTSVAGWAMAAIASSVTKVVPAFAASSSDCAA